MGFSFFVGDLAMAFPAFRKVCHKRSGDIAFNLDLNNFVVNKIYEFWVYNIINVLFFSHPDKIEV